MSRSTVVLSFAGVLVVGACSPSSDEDLGTGGSADVGGKGSSPSSTVGNGNPTTGETTGFGPTSGDASSSTGGPGSCADDTGCPAGEICDGGTCVAGCNDQHACAGTDKCCAGTCVDLDSDVAHCGACDNDCTGAMHVDVSCDGNCQYGACDAGYNDCDGAPGCETFGSCFCTANAVEPCYTGPVGTEGVGACTTGTRTCNATGTAWGACLGMVLPDNEICANGVDEDCNGQVDDVVDADGDGWTTCQGDCCDAPGAGCSDPALVNPGAFEAGGNMVDDNCDGMIDNVLGACDGGLVSSSGNAFDYASAIDLCQTAEENPVDPLDRRWGVIAANLYLANGAGNPNVNSRSIRPSFGGNVPPQAGTALAVFSSGNAAAVGQSSPSFASYQLGQNMGTTSPVPADWLAANGGVLPNAPGCPDPNGGSVANDPVMLRLRVRVPTNAQSFSVRSVFYSSEYPEWVCSPFNDFFVALLDSAFVPGMGQVANPADKNLATYLAPNMTSYPVGVNLAFGNTGLFTQCQNGATGCGPGSVSGNTNTCASTSMLTGTGYDTSNPTDHCGAGTMTGGATGWLTTSGNVVPGEVIELRFSVWDTGDHIYDSTLLLDAFQWSVSPSTPGTSG